MPRHRDHPTAHRAAHQHGDRTQATIASYDEDFPSGERLPAARLGRNRLPLARRPPPRPRHLPRLVTSLPFPRRTPQRIRRPHQPHRRRRPASSPRRPTNRGWSGGSCRGAMASAASTTPGGSAAHRYVPPQDRALQFPQLRRLDSPPDEQRQPVPAHLGGVVDPTLRVQRGGQQPAQAFVVRIVHDDGGQLADYVGVPPQRG